MSVYRRDKEKRERSKMLLEFARKIFVDSFSFSLEREISTERERNCEFERKEKVEEISFRGRRED